VIAAGNDPVAAQAFLAASAAPTADQPGHGQRLAYDRVGRGEPLVLLHPLGADRHVWRPIVPLLVDHRDVVNVDLPGFGGSPPLPDGATPHPRRLAAEVAGLLGRLGFDRGRAHLAGNSLGGWVALELALAGHAASVTAIAPAGLWPRPLAPKPQLARSLARIARPALPRALRSATVRRLALGSAVASPERVPPEQAADLLRAYAQAPGFTAVNRAMRAGTFARLSEIAVPVTLAWPDRDRLVARTPSCPPGVHEVTLHGCGHIPMWDDPRAVADLLLSGSVPPPLAAR
jgi:pimeloyl-ACP methyl ester carboxylesterase